MEAHSLICGDHHVDRPVPNRSHRMVSLLVSTLLPAIAFQTMFTRYFCRRLSEALLLTQGIGFVEYVAVELGRLGVLTGSDSRSALQSV